MLPTSKLPLIGASGAVAGVIAAYLILHPRVLVWVLAFRFIPLRITAAWVLGVWVATQLVMVLINRADQVAWWAHIGGMVAGAILILFMRRPGVPCSIAVYAGLTTAPIAMPACGPSATGTLAQAVVQSAAPVAQLTPNCRGPTLHFALAKRRRLPS